MTIIGVYESDGRRGAVDFMEEKDSAPLDVAPVLDEVEFLPFRRRVFEANTMYTVRLPLQRRVAARAATACRNSLAD